MVVVAQSGCNRQNVVGLGQKWLNSGKIGCNRANWLYS